MTMQVDVEELQNAFFEEAGEHLEQLDQALKTLAGEPENDEAFGTLFRTVHTLKGDSAAVGFDEISGLLRQCESALQTDSRRFDAAYRGHAGRCR